MNKLLISTIIIGIIVVALGASCTLQESDASRDSFFEVHLEPNGANNDMFNNLTDFVKLADRYSVKLTLLFTPPWAEMILKDSMKLTLLNKWRDNGHEIGGHHHGPSVCPWDSYTKYNTRRQRIRKKTKACLAPNM